MLLSVQKVKKIYGMSRRTLINRKKDGLSQSGGSKPGRVPGPLDGTSSDTCSNYGYCNLWQVLKVTVVTPLSLERVLRDFS